MRGSNGRASGLLLVIMAALTVGLLTAPSGNASVSSSATAVTAGSQGIGRCGGSSANGLTADADAADIAAWWREKTTEFLTTKNISAGFSAIAQLTGLDKIIFGDPNEKVLKELAAIQGQLADVQAQLDNLQTVVNQAIKEDRQNNFGRILTDLCDIANLQSSFFTDEYMAWIAAGVELGDALTANSDGTATARVIAAKAEVAKRQDEMVSQWTAQMTADSADINQRLLPGAGSVTTAYGKVLMTDRFLNQLDSDQLRALYNQFAQLEALASWMTVEVYQARGNTVGWHEAATRYTQQAKSEAASLPPMIPQGTVIDLGRENATTTFNQPMWIPPTTEDRGWFGGFQSTDRRQPGSVPANDEVGQTVKALNSQPNLGRDWGVPTSAQLTALLSSGCIVDPARPTQFGNKLPCKNAVPSGKGVAGYLLALNPMSETWQALFCVNTDKQSCAHGGAGPKGTPPHQFVWIKEQFSIWMRCGHTLLPPEWFKRTFTVHAGATLSADTTRIARRPYLPDDVPGPTFGNQLDLCDAYMNRIVNGAALDPQGFSGRGVVLATRQTDTAGFDTTVSPLGDIDYMSQIVGSKGDGDRLSVRARAQSRDLRVGRSATVVHKVKGSGKTRISAHCVNNGARVKHACRITVKATGGRVRVLPRCNDQIKVRVIIVRRDEGVRQTWQRTWRVAGQPDAPCSRPGTG